jgi:hypothetical protein
MAIEIVDLPTKKMLFSHSYVNVYQRVVHIFTHTDNSLQRITSWCQARSDWSVGTVFVASHAEGSELASVGA